RFIESGWSVKSLHRLIMNSAVYQMAGTANEEAALADPENRLMWRFPRRRHSAEVLRDTLLATSGRLDSRMGGRTLPIDNHKIMSTDEIAKCNQLFAQPRRTVYLPVVRSGLADVLADRCFQSADTDEARVTQLFRTVFQRLPTQMERQQAQTLLNDLSSGIAPEDATRREAWISLCRVLLSSNEFVYVD
ncbi:MAG: DUF1553 domain-containing protein, partial [Planctomycetota bacterium]|nr:DUF1553 domain-containing protein [Planctomycetota bacterium]